MELKTKDEIARMSLDEKKAYLQELKQQRAILASGEILRRQSGGLQAAAETMMKYDPTGAFNVLDKKTKTDIDRQELMLKAGGESKTKLLDEMKALTYAISTSKDPAQTELLQRQLTAINTQYLDKFGVGEMEGADVGNPDAWLADYIKTIAVASYGINADGGITDLTRMKNDIKSAARSQGYNALANSDKIDKQVESINADLINREAAKGRKKLEELDIAGKQQEISQSQKENIYKNIDTKYPDLRTKDIPNANKLIGFIVQGESGSTGSRNNAVKSLSRLGSDEALSETDFGRALGRSGVLSTLAKWAKADVTITDAEWNKVKSDIMAAIDNVKRRRQSALNDFTPVGYRGTLLEQIANVPTGSQAPPQQAQKKTVGKQTGNLTDLDKALGL